VPDLREQIERSIQERGLLRASREVLIAVSGGFTKPSTIKPGPDDPVGQLYNLRNDPAEKDNLYSQQPDTVARLEAEMDRIIKSGHGR